MSQSLDSSEPLDTSIRELFPELCGAPLDLEPFRLAGGTALA